MTVAKAIELLQKMPQDIELYFDCPNCGRGNLMVTPTQAVIVKTEKSNG